jgi:hypothetical protein
MYQLEDPARAEELVKDTIQIDALMFVKGVG